MMVLMDNYQGMDLDNEDEMSSKQQKQQPIRRHRRSKKIPLLAIIGRPNVGKYGTFQNLDYLFQSIYY